MVIVLIVGLLFAFGGAVVLLSVTAVEGVGFVLGTLAMGLIFLSVGAYAAIRSVVEMFMPTRVYIEDDTLVIHRKGIRTIAHLTFLNLTDIQGALVDTELGETDSDNPRPIESYRVVLRMTDEGRIPLADYHHMSDMNEARALAGRVEEMLKDARAGQ